MPTEVMTVSGVRLLEEAHMTVTQGGLMDVTAAAL